MIILFDLALLLLILPNRMVWMPLALIAVALTALFCFKTLGRAFSPKQAMRQPVFIRICSVLITARFVCSFFLRWRVSPKVAALAASLHASPSLLVLLAGVLLFLPALFAVLAFFAAVNPWLDREGKRGKFLAWLASREKSGKESAVLATGSAVAFFLSQTMLVLWANTDNYRISLVLNGIFSEENYCIFLHPAVAYVVKAIDRLLPHADGFVLLLEVLLMTGFWCIFYLLFRVTKKSTALLTVVSVIILNYSINLLHAAFTLAAMLLTGIGFLLVYAYVREKAGLPFVFIGSLLVIFGSFWRFNAFLLVTPYIALVIAADAIRSVKEKTNVSKYLTKTLCCLVPLFLLCGIGRYATLRFNAQEAYSYGIAYNEHRSNLYDYKTADYDEVRDELERIGVSENDYEMLKSLIICDTDVIDRDYLQTVSEIGKLPTNDKISTFFKTEIVTTLIKIKFEPMFYYVSFLLFAYALFFLLCTKGDVLTKLEVAASFAGTVLILVYFAYDGHLPVYMMKGLTCCSWLVLFSAFVLNGVSFDGVKRSKRFSFALTLILISFTLDAFAYTGVGTKSVFDTSLNAKDYDGCEQSWMEAIDASNDTVFIWGVPDRNRMLEESMQKSGKLVDREFLRHNILDGEWTYAQPYFVDLLESADIGNPVKALFRREHTYYVAKEERANTVLTYVREHYDEDIAAEQVGCVGEVPVWRYVK